MEPVRSKARFLQAVEASGLLSDEQLRLVRYSESEDEPAELFARHLLDLGWLTDWQVEHLLAGRTAFHVDGYSLQHFLGRGRMGLVFRAIQRSTGRAVAVKIMAKELLENERSVQRFLREIRLIAQTSHPNIVTAFDAGKLRDGRYYLVTEYVAGRDLAKWLGDAGSLPVGWACECAYQACLGLQHVLDKGLVHRDIKPSNIVAMGNSVDERPCIKMLDLGLGRFTRYDSEERDLTRDGYTLGTFEYASPEQVRDARSVDIRADIYSLGTTLFQLLTGRLPFEGENLVDKLTAKLTQDPPLVSELRSDVPRALSEIVAWMMRREPDQRPVAPVRAAEALLPFAMSRATESTVTINGGAKRRNGASTAAAVRPFPDQ